LLRCLAGYESYNGDIIFEEWLDMQKIGFLETQPPLISKITGWEYLKLVCLSYKNQFEKFENANLFGLPLRRYTTLYSTGMKKKLVLTSILLQENDLLLLDEPFSGLDIQSNILIIELLRQMQRQGTSIIISSHTLTSLQDICDKIIHLRTDNNISIIAPEEYSSLEEELKQNVIEGAHAKMRYFLNKK